MTVAEHARALIAGATRIVGFTGAGISTESGIPDFRSEDGGLWTRHSILTLQEFKSSEAPRAGFWRMALSLWPTLRDARPNAGHDAFVELHRQGRLDLLVTQNIDSLHQRAGLPAEKVIEMHGAATEAVCLTCGDRIAADEAARRVEAGDAAPRCRSRGSSLTRPARHARHCDGLLKPAVTLFGEDLPPGVLARATAALDQCDLLLVVGSSLEVEPAASLPALARNAGARLVVVNRAPTPLDGSADAVVHGEIGDMLPDLVRSPGKGTSSSGGRNRETPTNRTTSACHPGRAHRAAAAGPSVVRQKGSERMPEGDKTGVTDFDLTRAIIALANEPFDPMPGGMKTPESARSRLRRVVDTAEWYEWPINDEKLRAQTGITLRSHSPLDRNIELKRELHARFRRALGDEREGLVDYYVETWGGINIGDATRRRYAREHPATLADEGIKNIASRSKALVLHNPSRYAIYDSRVAVSLNYLVIRRVGHDRGPGHIGWKDGRKCFPLPPSQAKGTTAAHEACRTLSERFDIPFYDSGAPDFYHDYLRAIREAAWRLSDSERREICIHWVESMLFGMAERCAAGLHAACRFSDPLSFTVVDG